MLLFLQIVGAVVVSLLVLAVGGYLTFRWYLRRKFGARVLKLMEQGHAPVVARITLVPSSSPPANGEDTAQLIAALHRLGYRKTGWYAAPEMANLQLWAGVHADGSAAAVYDHPALAPFFDLVRMHADRKTLTITSSRMHNPDNVPPGCEVLVDPDWTPEEARTLLEAQPQADELLTLTSENFVAEFQDAYARGMDYMLAKRTTPTREELALTQQQWGGPHDLNEEQVEETLRAVRRDRLLALREAIVDRFLESGQVSAHQWQRLSDRVVVVHQQMSVQEAIELAIEAAAPGTDLRAARTMGERIECPMEAFEAADAELGDERRHTPLGAVEQPVPARVYAQPA